MTYTFKLSRRIARLRSPLLAALLVTLAGCDGTNALNPDANNSPSAPTSETSAAFAGGIPFGLFAMPTGYFGDRYNGALRNISPYQLLDELRSIKARGGKVVLMFAGSQEHYKKDGHFSLTLWKARVDRFRVVDFSSYVRDGTIIGHYMIDEPYDPENWGGDPVSPSVLEEMGRYSKQLWPEMPTVIRAEPGYLASNHRYVDAAWAQYLERKGSAADYIRKHVADAQERGLALIVGLNILDGGTPNLTPMTASEIESWGSALLASSYPCAFISWTYDERFVSSNGVPGAMDDLRRKAENRATRTCRRVGSGSTPEPEPDPEPDPEPSPEPSPEPGSGVPFGPYSVTSSAMASFSGAVQAVTPANVLATARAARQAGARLVLRLANGEEENADGTFNLDKWKAAIDRYRSIDLGPFITDGTIMGHLLVQNPQYAERWGNRAIPQATLDEMARYSRGRWPGITTMVQAPARWLADKSTAWQYLDAAAVMYAGSSGDAATWIAAQAAAASDARLGLMVGMNVLNGGTSASGIPGDNDGKYAMSPTQLGTWGAALLTPTRVCGLMLSSYDADYFGRSDVKAAVAKLRDTASTHAGTSCRMRT
jgi:hypothetical protein